MYNWFLKSAGWFITTILPQTQATWSGSHGVCIVLSTTRKTRALSSPIAITQLFVFWGVTG